MEENIPITPEPSPAPPSAGKRELVFCLLSLPLGLGMANFVLFGGFNLGFAIVSVLSILSSVRYLHASGHRGDWYTRSLVVLSLIIAASFAYSSDVFVKFVLFCFLVTGVNLALCQTAGQNRRHPGSVRSLLDAPRAFFTFGIGKMGSSFRMLKLLFTSGGESSRRAGAVLAGLAIAVPVLVVMIPLLMSSDAAFEGLMDLLPEFELSEAYVTVVWGSVLFAILYSRSTALHSSSDPVLPETRGRGLHPLTVNTLLSVVCLLYGVYLFSQIAYFSGGFLGILPEGYSIAEYARRGFFEMALLSGINLGLITFGVGMVSRQSAVMRSTRLLCLAIGCVTLFLIGASFAKMLLYIGTYGLTRLRVLTMAIITFLAVTTVLVCVWLFVPRLEYMRFVVLTALIIGAVVVWMDVDTVVARYNVEGYLSGRLETVDTAHLGSLGDGALQYAAKLTEAEDPEVAEIARDLVNHWYVYNPEDFRSWNYISHSAQAYDSFIRRDTP